MRVVVRMFFVDSLAALRRALEQGRVRPGARAHVPLALLEQDGHRAWEELEEALRALGAQVIPRPELRRIAVAAADETV